MKYKLMVSQQLSTLLNRLEGLKNSIEGNKLNGSEVIRQLQISIESVNQILEKVELEGYDSTAYQSR